MEAKRSELGTSWADQWDYNNPDAAEYGRSGGVGSSVSKMGGGGNKLSKQLDKTKAAASTGVKKVKEGASLGIHWIKAKCQKNTTKKP